MGSIAFEECVLAEMRLRNRIVRSATVDPYGAGDGMVSGEQIAYYRMLTENQVGLIISGMLSVSPEGIAGRLQTGAHDDRFIPGHRALTDAVHLAGGKVIAQINHAGDCSVGTLPPSPSGISSAFAKAPSHEMSIGEIAAATSDFAGAALRMKQAGYDGVQIHCAHGYLLSQFLNPKYNKRNDAYGGTAEKRFRFAGEVIAAVRAAVGPDYPVMIKLNSNTEEDDEAYGSDLLRICGRCRELGVCAVELSGHDFTQQGRKGNRHYYLERAKAVRSSCGLPVILVGGIRSVADMDEVLGGGVDMVSISRPFICEPDLIPRLLAGQDKASCLSCSKCFILQGKYAADKIRCIQHRQSAS